jgi:glycosyltransferase involved in cell wall biosynthesis
MNEKKGRILVLVAHYLPGFRSGGPVRSISNLVEKYGEVFDFKVVTRDRDYLSDTPFPEAASGTWVTCGHASVLYLGGAVLLRMLAALQRGDYDIVFLNSLFERRFSIFPLLLRRLGIGKKCPYMLAPRGELGLGALAIRSRRKRFFLWLAKVLQLYRGVIWQASHDLEKQDIVREFGENVVVKVVPDGILPGPYFRGNPSYLPNLSFTDAARRRVRVIFLSRISPKKNLAFAIKVLQSCKAPMEFDVYGPIDDAQYWQECLKGAERLPSNVVFSYKGETTHEQVARIFSQYDVLFFPTLGENYGHVVIESLAAGCPVLISDTTPWLDLDSAGAGWVCSLEDEGRFTQILDSYASGVEQTKCSRSARSYALEYFAKLETSGVRFEVFSDVLKDSRREGLAK